MNYEKKYSNTAPKDKIKKYGQYFTPYAIADFMINWILEGNPKSILDPAVGNGVFFRNIVNTDIDLIGYEIDKDIIEFFKEKNKINYKINFKDFLINDWNKRFDAIICNPPYNRFQMIANREKIRGSFLNIADFSIDGYTNQYIMFLIKSILQLNNNGRIAYIIPTEFLNSGYGEQIKSILINKRILKAIIGFDDSIKVFSDALTTACIVLLEKKNNENVSFINISNIDLLKELNLDELEENNNYNFRRILYEELDPKEKWEQFLQEEVANNYNNLVEFSLFAKAKRGIATGDNSYFVFNKSKKEKFNINNNNLIPCITKSSDLKSGIFDMEKFNLMKEQDKNVFIFDGTLFEDEYSKEYIKYGINNEVNKKYLTKSRKIWYQAENKRPGDILMNVFSRGKLKIVRNLTEVRNLTTYHSIYMNEDSERLVNILFCYLLTPIGQEILYKNKRVYGGGLSKFEPNDVNQAMILNLNILSEEDIERINTLYRLIEIDGVTADITNNLNQIFLTYL